MKSLQDILLPYQKDFILSPKRRKIWLAARQIGKSFSLGYLSVYKALSKKGGLALIISTGARASSEIMKKVQQFADAVKIMSSAKIDYTASADCVKFNNGSRVLALPSGNPAALRGYTSVATIIDEAAFIEHPDDVLAAILPTLTRDANSELILASTPAGKNSLFYDMYQKAIGDDDWYVQTTTIFDAQKSGLKVDIESLKTLCPDPDIFAQEYECKWLSEYGTFINPDVVVFADEPSSPVVARYMGYDVGGTGDRTAIATVCQLKDGTFYLEDIVVLNKTPYTEQLNILKALHAKNKWNSGYIDSQGIGNPMAEFANRQVSARFKGFAWTGSNKTQVIEHTRGLIFDKKLTISSNLKTTILNDFKNIQKLITEDGKVKYVAGHDENGHSDSASALFLALWSAHDNPVSLSVPSTYIRSSLMGSWGSRL